MSSIRRALLSSLLFIAAPVAVALSAGCAATAEEETASSESELAASMVKIDPVPLVLDGHERLVDYVPTLSRFHAFEVHAKPGAELDIHVDARSLTAVGGSSASAISYKRYLVDSQGRSFAQPTRLRLPSHPNPLR